MTVRTSQDGIYVGEFGIGFAGLRGEIYRLFVALCRERRPALAQTPDHHQRTPWAEKQCLLQMQQSSLIIAAKAVTNAQISAGKHRVGVEIESQIQAASGFIVAARKQVEDRQGGMCHG